MAPTLLRKAASTFWPPEAILLPAHCDHLSGSWHRPLSGRPQRSVVIVIIFMGTTSPWLGLAESGMAAFERAPPQSCHCAGGRPRLLSTQVGRRPTKSQCF
jgi:hypothetical protein